MSKTEEKGSVSKSDPKNALVQMRALVGIEIKGGDKLSARAGESFETTPERAAKLIGLGVAVRA